MVGTFRGSRAWGNQVRLAAVGLVLIFGALTAPAAAAQSGQLPPATRSFHSVPALHPPALHLTSDPDSSSGDIFLTPFHSYQGGPMILSPSGELIWFQPVSGWTANLELQHYQGQPVLTWWQGRTATSPPEDVIMDTSYRTVAVIPGVKGSRPDLHEFQITPQGTALINTISTVNNINLSAVGGPASASVSNNIIEEVDIATGQVLWRWGSLGHVPVTASYELVPTSGPYDYFHLNSIQQLPGGNLLVSARDTSAVYLIDKQTGNIIWTLGGKQSSFTVGPGANFAWQHDAHLVGQTLTLFNDNWGGEGSQQGGPATALTLHLNSTTMTATLVHSYGHSPSVITGTQGSMQTLPNGNVFVGWGADPDFSEYTSGGSQIFNGNFALGVKSYRAYRFPWVAQPLSQPALAVAAASGGGLTLYASWNGATQVSVWRVVGGATASTLQWVGRAVRTGFETTINLKNSYPYVEVMALNASGQVVGTSRLAAAPQP
jgi:hypothetical protein